MPDTEPQGCLTAILGLFGIRLSGPSAATDRLPYRTRDDFLSAAELSFYQVLRAALNGTYTVCPKVNLADLFFVARPQENQSHRNRIDRKHVDFLLCDPATMRPVLGVELDDASHARPDRRERDRFVERVFEAAGLPLLRVPAAAGYRPPQITDLVRQAIEGRGTTGMMVTQQGGTPVCPKCGSPMVLRTATKGDRKGRKFWGCAEYPKCRETVSV